MPDATVEALRRAEDEAHEAALVCARALSLGDASFAEDDWKLLEQALTGLTLAVGRRAKYEVAHECLCRSPTDNSTLFEGPRT